MSSVDPSAEFLSPEQFAQHSGYSLTTVHRYLKRGLLPKIQPGGPRSKVLIPRNALDSLSSGLGTATAGSDQAAAKVSPPVAAATEALSSRLSGPRPAWMKSNFNNIPSPMDSDYAT